MNSFLWGKRFQQISKDFNTRLKWLLWYVYLHQKCHAKFIGRLIAKFKLIPITFHKRKCLAIHRVVSLNENVKVDLIYFHERYVIRGYLEDNCPNYFPWFSVIELCDIQLGFEREESNYGLFPFWPLIFWPLIEKKNPVLGGEELWQLRCIQVAMFYYSTFQVTHSVLSQM